MNMENELPKIDLPEDVLVDVLMRIFPAGSRRKY